MWCPGQQQCSDTSSSGFFLRLVSASLYSQSYSSWAFRFSAGHQGRDGQGRWDPYGVVGQEQGYESREGMPIGRGTRQPVLPCTAARAGQELCGAPPGGTGPTRGGADAYKHRPCASSLATLLLSMSSSRSPFNCAKRSSSGSMGWPAAVEISHASSDMRRLGSLAGVGVRFEVEEGSPGGSPGV